MGITNYLLTGQVGWLLFNQSHFYTQKETGETMAFCPPKILGIKVLTKIDFTLPENNSVQAPENGLEYDDCFLLGQFRPIFRGHFGC